MSNPEEIQAQIEQTRNKLSGDVDRLEDKVSPARVASRQVDRIKSRSANLRDRVMGSGDDGSGLRGAGESMASVAGSAKDSVSSAPQAVRSRAQGNPLAAGLIAFGIGMVLASLAPASEAEQQLAAEAEDKVKELAEPAKDVGQQIVQEMKPAVQDAAEQVKSAAQDAAQETTEQAKSSADDVRAPLQE